MKPGRNYIILANLMVRGKTMTKNNSGQAQGSRRRFLVGSALTGAALGTAPSLALGQKNSTNNALSRMKITRVEATPLAARTIFDHGGVRKPGGMAACYVEVETADGLIGHGITSITIPAIIADIVNKSIAPAIRGDNPMAHEAIWNKLYWLLSPRGQTGFASHAMAAVDIALWDIKGKALGVPIATLLGGARKQVPIYVTSGPSFLSREELVAVAKDLVKRGFNGLKMVVANHALKNRDEQSIDKVLAEDAERVRVVREAVGVDVDLHVDANHNLDYTGALKLIRLLQPYDISFFEEPVTQNDVHLLADLRRITGVVIAAGQNEGLAYRFRDMLMARAVDYVQPNVMITGGYTQVMKIAGMAEAFNVAISNGGAAPLQNMHLHAGLANGGAVEWHLPFMDFCKMIYKDMPEPVAGTLDIPERPGLGFEPDRDVIREIAAAGRS